MTATTGDSTGRRRGWRQHREYILQITGEWGLVDHDGDDGTGADDCQKFTGDQSYRRCADGAHF
jgi:hypothetical protein